MSQISEKPAAKKRVAIIGSGPAALMAADVLTRQGGSLEIHLFEKRKSAGRKLLIAGSSGLNITNTLPLEKFASHYSPQSPLWLSLLEQFSSQNWCKFIESELGVSTFEGSSQRCFVENMKAAKMLQSWVQRLKNKNVQFHFDSEVIEFKRSGVCWEIEVGKSWFPSSFDALCFCLGGGSYEESPVRWPEMFIRKGVSFEPWTPSNVGYQVQWDQKFLAESEGQALKNVTLQTARGVRRGDLMVTRYGLEGTPVYTVGVPGLATLDLKPDSSLHDLEKSARAVKENLSPMRRIQRRSGLCEAAFSLLFHSTTAEEKLSLDLLLKKIKTFPIELCGPQPLLEAISSCGGIGMNEINDDLMIRSLPGIFVAGEMLNWDAPTGGFLIQACVSQGYRAGWGIIKVFQSEEMHGGPAPKTLL